MKLDRAQRTAIARKAIQVAKGLPERGWRPGCPPQEAVVFGRSERGLVSLVYRRAGDGSEYDTPVSWAASQYVIDRLSWSGRAAVVDWAIPWRDLELPPPPGMRGGDTRGAPSARMFFHDIGGRFEDHPGADAVGIPVVIQVRD